MVYVQVVDNVVNLIGDESVGLPLSEKFLDEHPNISCIAFKNSKSLPSIGDYYIDGKFMAPEEYFESLAPGVAADEEPNI